MSLKKKSLHLLTAVLIYFITIGNGALLSHSSSTQKTEKAPGGVYILGPARALLSEGFYERADTYFHKGVPHQKKEAFHGFFQKWKEALCPTKHVHAKGREIEEVLPWLRLATQSDPHNVEAYLVASFWLTSRNRPDLALNAIQEAIIKNPNRYELLLEKGRINLATDNYVSAEADLQHALYLITKTHQTDPAQAILDLPFIYMAQSYLSEALGKRKEAILTTESYLKIHQKQHFIERIQKLKTEPINPDLAKDRLQELFHKTHHCDHGDHCDFGEEHSEHKHTESHNCTDTL